MATFTITFTVEIDEDFYDFSRKHPHIMPDLIRDIINSVVVLSFTLTVDAATFKSTVRPTVEYEEYTGGDNEEPDIIEIYTTSDEALDRIINNAVIDTLTNAGLPDCLRADSVDFLILSCDSPGYPLPAGAAFRTAGTMLHEFMYGIVLVDRSHYNRRAKNSIYTARSAFMTIGNDIYAFITNNNCLDDCKTIITFNSTGYERRLDDAWTYTPLICPNRLNWPALIDAVTSGQCPIPLDFLAAYPGQKIRLTNATEIDNPVA